jgi:hypothetical protein
MTTKRFTIGITAGIAVVSLLIVGTAATSILSTTHAQTATLGEPFFVEEGKVTVQKEIGPNRTQITFTGNGTLNGNIEVNNTGKLVSVSKGNNLSFEQGQGVYTTKDGETANYTLIAVNNGTNLQGAKAWNTNSTGQLSFLNNILSIFKGGLDDGGNFAIEYWHWK